MPPVARLRRTDTALLVVDFQERLLPAIWERERAVANAVRLIRGVQVLGLPILATEQYRRGLGATVPEVQAALGSTLPIEKLSFSACAEPSLVEALGSLGVDSVILCGIEAHVCVSQTCLDLLERDCAVFVVADAVSSRTEENRRIGLDRMRAAGALIVSTEMVLFELLGGAGTDEFKQVLPLVKDR